MSTLKVPVVAEDHIQGDANAVCTLVEYGDYECPYCGQAYPIVKRIQKHFGDRLRLVFRNFPLKEMHPHAEFAAETAEFAAAHGKFWEMHDALYENQTHLGGPLYEELAKKLKLAPADLAASLEKREFQAKVRADFSGGVRSGVNGTPTFFINGQRHDDSYEYEVLVAAIEAALPKASAAQ
ncbi:MAG TPA: thioredoxin domain-containing protein [Candidatus Acidoferrales bacterium]|jgi:protein-disulfide isomerase|nr:thioredoxin domain-containing protein [Candidatus Acidoferrales bacterium]